MLKIAVVNFWESAFKNDFFDYFLNLAAGKDFIYVDDVNQADIFISSVFGNTITPAEKTIFYIGENLRPNYYRCKYSLSFDDCSWGGRTFYLPLWYARLAWPGFTYVNQRNDGVNTHGYEDLIDIGGLITPRSPISAENLNDKRFCALIAGNPEALRLNLFNFISRYQQIDGYGRFINNPFFDSKFKILSNYKFSLCPENALFPGYVTEKLFDAYWGGTVPIYYGGIKSNGEINPLAFVDFTSYKEIEELVEKIISLNTNLDEYNKYYCQPLLKRPPTLDNAIAFLKYAIEDIAK
jgi:hypothetical protein